jgi:lysophospholipase L1-like esterase
LVSGCDDESLTAPEVENDLFNSYVALGNSITAGFQSSGINQTTQQQSYAVLLADQMNTPFTIPALASPGCPPPLSQLFPQERVSDQPCAFREQTATTALNNVAVPNATVADILRNEGAGASPNTLTQFILGGQTQIEAAKRSSPTFLTSWIGNNDILSGALAGDTSLVTPPDSFETRYSQLLSEIESIESLKGAAFIGVADPTLIPHFSRGAAYKQAIETGQDTDALPPNIETQSCNISASGAVLVPFQHGAALLQAAIGLSNRELSQTITLDCSRDRTVEETIRQSISDNLEDQILNQIGESTQQISLLVPQEISVLKNRVASFNQSIRDEIGNDYAYVNPNPLFENNSDQIPAFPELFENPNTPWNPNQPFGPLFSLDGIHPSETAHRVVTSCLISKINGKYDTSLQQFDEQSCPIQETP